MRWDSPFVLATAGAIAIHVIIGVIGDALVVLYPPIPDPPPAPHIEIVDVELPPIVKPPPPPVAPPEPEKHEPRPTKAQPQVRAPSPPPVEPPPATPPPPSPEPSGGAPVISAPDIAPAATGVPVAVGPRNTGHVGRGGTGTGTGSGSGAGSAEAPAPMSVATIKTRAMPRGDYSYQETDYPAEAKQLGIEGKIRVKLVVDEHGAVTSALLLNKLGHGLDELALKRANQIQFEPARDSDDHPVASVVVWTFDLTLPK